MKLHELVETSLAVAGTSSRKAKSALLAQLLSRVPNSEIAAVVGMLIGEPIEGRIGIGGAGLTRALADTSPAATPSLSIADVQASTARIAAVKGKGSQTQRASLLADLMSRAVPEERDFLTRLWRGDLRQGALGGVMIEAIAEAAGLPVEVVRRAELIGGELPAVAAAAMAEGEAGLARWQVELFRPLQPMKAQTAETVEQVLQQFSPAAWEYKLDGVRVQIHKQDSQVRIYSRNLRDITHSLPEIVSQIQQLPTQRFILDGEVLALRPDGMPHSFQVSMRRIGRDDGGQQLRESLPLSVFVFDLLLVDDQAMIDQANEIRFEQLRSMLPGSMLIDRIETADQKEAARFLEAALARGHEGLLAKSLSSIYQAGQRGGSWLKIKPSHTLDLVVVAVERGSGRRSGWLSNLHLAARDTATDSYAMIGKTFKGMTDAMLKWQTEHLRKLAVREEDYVVHVRPELVVEVAFNEIQASPHYESGYALRFARVKGYRTDKHPSEADTMETIRQLYRQRNPSDDKGVSESPE